MPINAVSRFVGEHDTRLWRVLHHYVDNAIAAQQAKLDKLKDCDLDTAKAYRLRLILQEIYRYPAVIAPMVRKDWIQWWLKCKLVPVVEVALAPPRI